MTKKTIEAHESVLDLVGNTPLIKLNETVKGFQGSYYAKAEFTNPGHSNKDRIALYIIEEAERKAFSSLEILLLRRPQEILVTVLLWPASLRDINGIWRFPLNHHPIKLICFVPWELQFLYALVM